MFNIRLNAKDDHSGKIVYNAGIVHNIVELAIAEVEGVAPSTSPMASTTILCTIPEL